ncbi:hypothetical protein [Ottowia thiooxydans]|uniref:hypothetical protein n=1 Tax=Ottowia thiooxydans TaxID=219182 RepID=UPI000403202C|nr:hypothetical protein [Ottowia thiooxydans]
MNRNLTSLPIKICDETGSEIQKILDDIQGKAHANVLIALEVIEFAKEAERLLESAQIARSYRAGSTFVVVPEGPYAKAYGYKQTGTLLRIERRASGWFMTAAERVPTWPGQIRKEVLSLTSRQKTLVIRAVLREFRITVEEAASGLQEIDSMAFAKATA